MNSPTESPFPVKFARIPPKHLLIGIGSFHARSPSNFAWLPKTGGRLFWPKQISTNGTAGNPFEKPRDATDLD